MRSTSAPTTFCAALIAAICLPSLFLPACSNPLSSSPSTHRIAYVVSSSNPAAVASIRFVTPNGPQPPAVPAESRHALPWSADVAGFESGAYVMVQARTVDGTRATLHCQVSMDGRVVFSDDHVGTDVGAGCGGMLPD